MEGKVEFFNITCYVIGATLVAVVQLPPRLRTVFAASWGR